MQQELNIAETIPQEITAQFEIGAVVAEGRAGILYRAKSIQTGQQGVLKLLHQSTASTHISRQKLYEELKAQQSLKTNLLAAPIAFGVADEQLWLFRHWVEGESLRSLLLRERRLTQGDAIRIARLLARSLDLLHRTGLIHRDLKPEHIILRADDSTALIDTGVAAPIGVYEGHSLVGTPSYLAPEVGLGYMVSSRADLYALGCVFYEMITGHPPFGGDTDTLIIAGHIHLPVPSIDGELFEVCKTVLGQLLSKDPSQRPFSAQSVDELLAATDFYTDGTTRQRKSTKLGLGEAARYTPDGRRADQTPVEGVRPQDIEIDIEGRDTQEFSGSFREGKQPRSRDEYTDPQSSRSGTIAMREGSSSRNTTGRLGEQTKSEKVSMPPESTVMLDDNASRMLDRTPPRDPRSTDFADALAKLGLPAGSDGRGGTATRTIMRTGNSGAPKRRSALEIIGIVSLVAATSFTTILIYSWWTGRNKAPQTTEQVAPKTEEPAVVVENPPPEPTKRVVKSPPPETAEAEKGSGETETEKTSPTVTPPVATNTTKGGDEKGSTKKGDSGSKGKDTTPGRSSSSSFERTLEDARTSFGAGKFSDAEAAYIKATDLRPDDHRAWSGLANTRMQQKKFGLAARAYEQAIRRAPKTLNYMLNLGAAYRMEGDKTAAIEAYKKVLEIYPDNDKAQAALKSLGQ